MGESDSVDGCCASYRLLYIYHELKVGDESTTKTVGLMDFREEMTRTLNVAKFDNVAKFGRGQGIVIKLTFPSSSAPIPVAEG